MAFHIIFYVANNSPLHTITNNNQNDIIKVQDKFQIALILVFAYHLCDSVRNLLALVYLVCGVKLACVELLYEVLSVNALLGIAAFVKIHDRFSHAGKVCSDGPPDGYNKPEYLSHFLVDRGQLLYALVIIYWCVLGV